jgi:hypothetical protein
MNEINLKLTIDEVNSIINALGRMPFADVYRIIEKIHIQAGKQTKLPDDKNMIEK